MNLKRPLILASSSPRRQFLMKEIGFDFTVVNPGVDESFPSTLPATQVPSYLAEKKAAAVAGKFSNEILITSDTVVILGSRVLNKPLDRDEAIAMLEDMKATTHMVITAVCFKEREKTTVLEERTMVTFHDLSRKDIESYVDTARPFDKAGAYGAQECLAPGTNPCSEEEIAFLTKINRLDIIEKSIAPSGTAMVAIKKIEGSYFNVMGLPIHKVYKYLVS